MKISKIWFDGDRIYGLTDDGRTLWQSLLYYRRLRQAICEKLHFSSLEYQSLDGVAEAIGLDRCKICTYCWNGKE